MHRKNVSGQNLSEVALFVMVIGVSIVSMQIYIQRAIQARYKAGVDYTFHLLHNEAEAKGETALAASIDEAGRQYDPYYQSSSMVENKISDNVKGWPDSSTNQTSIRYGWKRTGLVDDAD